MLKITDKELEILKICWVKGETITRDIYEESLKYKKRTFGGVKTLLEKMVEKNLLTRRVLGHTAFYAPSLTKYELIKKMLNGYASDILNGSVVPFFINYLGNTTVEKEELEMLKKKIEELEEDSE